MIRKERVILTSAVICLFCFSTASAQAPFSRGVNLTGWCEDLQIYLMIDNHTFDPNVDTSPEIGNILTKVWSQTAAHLKDRSDYILYEILNEPHGITTAAWGTIQQQVISAIRVKDNRHTIVVGGSGYNSYNELASLP